MASLAVVMTTGAVIMVDCGEGTQHHIKVSTSVRPARIEAILLTHLHGDHYFGLFGLLHTMAMDGRTDPVSLVGPVGVQKMVKVIFETSGGWCSEGAFPLEFVEIPNCGAGNEDLVDPDGLGFSAERCKTAAPFPLGVHAGLAVQAVPLVHTVPDWGYVFREPDRLGALDVARATELGVPPGPLLGELKRGREVEVEDGTVVSPEQVLKPPVPGRTLAVLLDSADSCAALEPCRAAECIVHEATFQDSMREDALAKGHSTSSMAASFAAACGAKQLVLTHFSARYSTDTLGTDLAESLGIEARNRLGVSGPPVVVAKDFMVLRGDRDFEPDSALALRMPPWYRLPSEASGDLDLPSARG